MPAPSLVRTIYLYLLAFIGLVLLVIGCVGFVNMGLRAFVFTKADDEQRFYEEVPPYPSRMAAASLGATVPDSATVAREDSAKVEWTRQRRAIDLPAARRQREAASNASYILIGLPLYLYHWRLIRRDANKAGDSA